MIIKAVFARLTIQRTSALVFAIFLCMFASAPSHAACTDPAGTEGQIIYNDEQNVPQVCTDTGWVALGILNPGAGGSGCTDPVAPEGRMIYNADHHVPQYCDGDDWRAMIGFVDSGGGGFPGPDDCPNIGDQCSDNTIYAGYHPTLIDGNGEWLFLHPNAYHGASSVPWSSVSVDTGADDIEDGKVNQDWIVANATISDYPAFELCDNLNQTSELGHTDWYLGSRVEMYYLWAVRAAINAGPGAAFPSSLYNTSTESSSANRYYQNYNNAGAQAAGSKTTLNGYVRCLRRQPA